ncbi:lycopene cyclase domain-containing protein [Filimonas lacunae]|uniref:Lycopene cyclase domain-containing protein n=1 Tax=Filimonas lacunae TaxID=477680 RepID=A0A173MIL3_9BACT|nr:lycopene cyclase domain-containing protein [Filimonas lacunae]BAV07473.1 lycopene cyclase [Filimonas lacunae]SIT30242.1 lycopene cyclase domain-containing protein [Filimonas lacunae]
MAHYTYLLVNFLTVIFCFIFSFHPKIHFNHYFLPYIKSSIIVAIPFIIWDAWFTKAGVWWFNDRYLLGIRLLGLPIEEWLFFICIPFSCLFTWFVIQKHWRLPKYTARFQQYFTLIGIFACLVITASCTGKIYPFVTFLVAAASLFYLQFIARVSWIVEISCVYTLLLIPFFIVNGVLTGTGLEEPIVNYNPATFFNIRILTVPIEDAVYGYTLIIWNIYFFKRTAQMPHGNIHAG